MKPNQTKPRLQPKLQSKLMIYNFRFESCYWIHQGPECKFQFEKGKETAKTFLALLPKPLLCFIHF